MRDHPRIRGEHPPPTDFRSVSGGSSPHTRGAPRHLHLRRQTSRIIPAYAGSTFISTSRRPEIADHPRIRGEHERNPPEIYSGGGSSPHTRGARGRISCAGGRRGIIPAYAGSTTGGGVFASPGWDHPRIRGEHRRWVGLADYRGGIIPAYAGSTMGSSGT